MFFHLFYFPISLFLQVLWIIISCLLPLALLFYLHHSSGESSPQLYLSLFTEILDGLVACSVYGLNLLIYGRLRLLGSFILSNIWWNIPFILSIAWTLFAGVSVVLFKELIFLAFCIKSWREELPQESVDW